MPSAEVRTRTARIYMRPDGIVVSQNLPDVGEQTLEDAKENIRAVAEVAGDVRAPLFVDASERTSIAADARKYYVSEESARFVTAVAIVATNVMSRVVMNLLIPITRPPVPMEVFPDEQRAFEWLRKSKAGPPRR